MANIGDLEQITTRPRNLWEWLDRFNNTDREKVIRAILTGATSELYPVLSDLEENPYPFEQDTINDHRAKLRKAVA